MTKSMLLLGAIVGATFVTVAAAQNPVTEERTYMPDYCVERDVDCVIPDGPPPDPQRILRRPAASVVSPAGASIALEAPLVAAPPLTTTPSSTARGPRPAGTRPNG